MVGYLSGSERSGRDGVGEDGVGEKVEENVGKRRGSERRA